MRCKYDCVLSIVREQLHREPDQGDVFIMMSKNRRLVHIMYDKVGSMLFEKKIHTGYQFMKVVFITMYGNKDLERFLNYNQRELTHGHSL